jgi:ribosome maturation factor RimP
MGRGSARLHGLIEPIVEGMGYELVGVEYHSGGPGTGILRVYIDHGTGVTIDDCERVSYQLSGMLDVEDPIMARYRLEVSSPGLDRPLFQRNDYERFSNRRVKVRLSTPLDGRRNFCGLLRGMRHDSVVVEDGDTEYLLPLEQIERANLVPQL